MRKNTYRSYTPLSRCIEKFMPMIIKLKENSERPQRVIAAKLLYTSAEPLSVALRGILSKQ